MRKADERVTSIVKLEIPNDELWEKFESCFTHDENPRNELVPAILTIDIMNASEPSAGQDLMITTFPSMNRFTGRLYKWNKERTEFEFSVNRTKETRTYSFAADDAGYLTVSVEIEGPEEFESLEEFKKMLKREKFSLYMRLFRSKELYADRHQGFKTHGEMLMHHLLDRIPGELIESKSVGG